MSARTLIWITIRRPQILRAVRFRAPQAACRTSTKIYMQRENGWAISGLSAYYDVTATRVLAIAERAPRAIDNRALPNGGFRPAKRSRRPLPRDTLGDGPGLPDLYAADRQS